MGLREKSSIQHKTNSKPVSSVVTGMTPTKMCMPLGFFMGPHQEPGHSSLLRDAG